MRCDALPNDASAMSKQIDDKRARQCKHGHLCGRRWNFKHTGLGYMADF